MSRIDRVTASVGVLIGLLAPIANVAGGQTLDAVSGHARVRVDLPSAERS